MAFLGGSYSQQVAVVHLDLGQCPCHFRLATTKAKRRSNGCHEIADSESLRG